VKYIERRHFSARIPATETLARRADVARLSVEHSPVAAQVGRHRISRISDGEPRQWQDVVASYPGLRPAVCERLQSPHRRNVDKIVEPSGVLSHAA
jgi:hypothetical protein